MLAAAGLVMNVSHAGLVSVTDEAGAPLATVMVTQTVTAARKIAYRRWRFEYATPGKTRRWTPRSPGSRTRRRGALPDRPEGLSHRLRKPGFRDAFVANHRGRRIAAGRPP